MPETRIERWPVSRLVLMAAVIGLAPSMALAEDAGLTGPWVREHLAFDAADTNGDGVIDEAELTRDAAVGFAALDKDGNRKLTPSELEPHDPALFKKVDTNGDGVLTFKEVMTNKLRALQEGDKNHDGSLSFEEMVAVVEAEEGVKP